MFWFFLSVCVIADTITFHKGFESFIWKYKTDDEKKVQRRKLGLEEKP